MYQNYPSQFVLQCQALTGDQVGYTLQVLQLYACMYTFKWWLIIEYLLVCFLFLLDRLSVDDLAAVQRKLYPVKTDWYNLGLELGLRVSTLDGIDAKYSGDPPQCFRHVLKEWLKGINPVPTWQAMVNALKAPTVAHYHLAEQIQHELPPPQPQPLQSPSTAAKSYPTSSGLYDYWLFDLLCLHHLTTHITLILQLLYTPGPFHVPYTTRNRSRNPNRWHTSDPQVYITPEQCQPALAEKQALDTGPTRWEDCFMCPLMLKWPTRLQSKKHSTPRQRCNYVLSTCEWHQPSSSLSYTSDFHWLSQQSYLNQTC